MRRQLANEAKVSSIADLMLKLISAQATKQKIIFRRAIQ